MWNTPSKDRLNKMPRLYETESIPLQAKLVYLHFFIGGSDWFAVECDGVDTFFGFVILNNDYEMAEWGYFTLSELESIKVAGWLEIDCELEEHWKIRTACEIEAINLANGWTMEKESKSFVMGGL
jgi:hypothetical protein